MLEAPTRRRRLKMSTTTPVSFRQWQITASLRQLKVPRSLMPSHGTEEYRPATIFVQQCLALTTV